MILHPVAVAPDVDDVAVVHKTVDESRRHHLVAAMSLSLLKFVGQASLVDDAMLPS